MACPFSLGSLEGHTLTCACHDGRFDVRTGQFLDAAEISVPTYAVKSDASRLFVSFNRKVRADPHVHPREGLDMGTTDEG